MNRACAAEVFCARGRALAPGCAESGMSRAAAWGGLGFAIQLHLQIFGLSTRAVCARANFLRKNEFGVFGVRARGRFLRVRAGWIAGGALREKRPLFACAKVAGKPFSLAAVCGLVRAVVFALVPFRAVCARANFLRKTNFGVFGVRACGRFLRVRTGRIAGGALRAKLREDFALCAFASRFFDVSVRQKNDVRRAGLWGAREVFLRPAKARIGEIGRCDFFRGWEFAGSARRVSRAEGARGTRGIV